MRTVVISKLTIAVDNQEKRPLVFPSTLVEVVSMHLGEGDYTALVDGSPTDVRIERKSAGDLFGSFSHHYEQERNKILRCKDKGVKYVLVVESPCSEIRQGHEYRKGGESHRVKKDGLSMVRQLMTVSIKYGVEVHYFNGRHEMAFWIQEYLTSWVKQKGTRK